MSPSAQVDKQIDEAFLEGILNEIERVNLKCPQRLVQELASTYDLKAENDLTSRLLPQISGGGYYLMRAEVSLVISEALENEWDWCSKSRMRLHHHLTAEPIRDLLANIGGISGSHRHIYFDSALAFLYAELPYTKAHAIFRALLEPLLPFCLKTLVPSNASKLG